VLTGVSAALLATVLVSPASWSVLVGASWPRVSGAEASSCQLRELLLRPSKRGVQGLPSWSGSGREPAISRNWTVCARREKMSRQVNPKVLLVLESTA
jgi:hypothetical protein